MHSETFRFQVGDFECMAIQDGLARYPAGMFFTNLQKEQYEPALCQRGQSAEEMTLPYICLLIHTGRECVLVDTGAGRHATQTGKLLQLLRAEGIEPREIHTVILSHAHPDHIGGSLNENGEPAFPNARYIMFQKEWAYWMSNPSLAELPVDASFKERMLASVRKNLPPIQEQLDLIEPETGILPGIVALASFGHTPGHMALEIISRGARLLFVADAIIDPIDIEFPQALGVTDHQPEVMMATRVRLLRKSATEGALLATSHFPFPGLGHVLLKGLGWQWKPIPVGEANRRKWQYEPERLPGR
jgi:glyoxylase-like metal-dependent hydrolase (beta-lactamase superfamily II)